MADEEVSITVVISTKLLKKGDFLVKELLVFILLNLDDQVLRLILPVSSFEHNAAITTELTSNRTAKLFLNLLDVLFFHPCASDDLINRRGGLAMCMVNDSYLLEEFNVVQRLFT